MTSLIHHHRLSRCERLKSLRHRPLGRPGTTSASHSPHLYCLCILSACHRLINPRLLGSLRKPHPLRLQVRSRSLAPVTFVLPVLSLLTSSSTHPLLCLLSSSSVARSKETLVRVVAFVVIVLAALSSYSLPRPRTHCLILVLLVLAASCSPSPLPSPLPRHCPHLRRRAGR